MRRRGFPRGKSSARAAFIRNLAPNPEWVDEFNQRVSYIWKGTYSAADGLKRMRPAVQKALDQAWQEEQ